MKRLQTKSIHHNNRPYQGQGQGNWWIPIGILLLMTSSVQNVLEASSDLSSWIENLEEEYLLDGRLNERTEPSVIKSMTTLTHLNDIFIKMKDMEDQYKRREESTEAGDQSGHLSPIQTSPEIQYGTGSRFKIYPGTKWCGAGNRAKGHNDLGQFPGTDSCCREHDLCSNVIASPEGTRILTKRDRVGLAKHNSSPGSPSSIRPCSTTQYEVESYSLTISDCKCDNKLHRCLLNVIQDEGQSKFDRGAAIDIGNLYFNLLGMECIAQDPGKGHMWVARENPWFDKTRDPTTIESNPPPLTPVDPTKPDPLPPCPPPPCTLMNGRIGNCSVPLRGEYKEIETKAISVEVKTLRGETFHKIFASREDLLGMRVCNHPMRDHCSLPKGACGATLKTHPGEPNVVISFPEGY